MQKLSTWDFDPVLELMMLFTTLKQCFARHAWAICRALSKPGWKADMDDE